MNEEAESILRRHDADPSAFSAAAGMPGVWTAEVPGARATELWLALRDAFGETGLWPVIRGEPGEQVAGPVDVAGILAAVRNRPLREVFADRLEDERSFAAEMGLEVPPDADAVTLARMLDASGVFEPSGEQEAEPWPTKTPASNIPFYSTHCSQSGKPHPVVMMSLVNLTHPYEAPAYLGFGGWNDCPDPERQVEVLRSWHERFGAVPAAIAGDVMECVVARPPQNEADSFNLAVEQWLFCEDIVSQGCMSVRRLAIELWQKPKWFFWWD